MFTLLSHAYFLPFFHFHSLVDLSLYHNLSVPLCCFHFSHLTFYPLLYSPHEQFHLPKNIIFLDNPDLALCTWIQASSFFLLLGNSRGSIKNRVMLVFDQHNCSEELQDLSCGLDYHIIRTFLNVISNQFLRFFIVTFFSKMSFALIHGINRPQLWSSFQSPDGMLESFRL